MVVAVGFTVIFPVTFNLSSVPSESFTVYEGLPVSVTNRLDELPLQIVASPESAAVGCG